MRWYGLSAIRDSAFHAEMSRFEIIKMVLQISAVGVAIFYFSLGRLWTRLRRSNHPMGGERRANSEGANGGGSEEHHQLAAHIAQILRDAGVRCGVVNFVPADEARLRRDRIVVGLALTLLTALAWSYLLWLSADIDMGGMDMSGLRMIPSGMGLMMPPSHTPWMATEFAFVFAMWTVMMVAMMTPSAARTIFTFAREARCTEAQGTPFGATV